MECFKTLSHFPYQREWGRIHWNRKFSQCITLTSISAYIYSFLQTQVRHAHRGQNPAKTRLMFIFGAGSGNRRGECLPASRKFPFPRLLGQCLPRVVSKRARGAKMPVAVMTATSGAFSYRKLLEQCETQELEVKKGGGAGGGVHVNAGWRWGSRNAGPARELPGTCSSRQSQPLQRKWLQRRQVWEAQLTWLVNSSPYNIANGNALGHWKCRREKFSCLGNFLLNLESSNRFFRNIAHNPLHFIFVFYWFYSNFFLGCCELPRVVENQVAYILNNIYIKISYRN